MATKPNVLFFNGYISGQMKNENDKRGKTPRTAEFAIFGAPPKKKMGTETVSMRDDFYLLLLTTYFMI